jgi:hypothetical protein
MEEVPGSQGPLLALDDQQRFAGKQQEVLLVVLPVVDRHRLARPENLDVDAELREVRAALETLELAVGPTTLAV